MVRTRAVALVLVALLSACSSPDASAPQTQPVPSDAGPTIEPGAQGGLTHDHGSHGGMNGSKKGHGPGKEHGDRTDGPGDGSVEGGGEGGGSGTDAPDASDDGEGETQAAYPAGGAYVYSQKGSEAFCDPSGSCDRHDLPPTQKVATSYGQRTHTEAIVITEVRSSDGRYVKTSTHFTPDAAFVTEVYYRLVYEGLSLSEQYNPDPPVPQLRFPLRAGRQWDASWKADTSGDYHAKVTGVESVSAGGEAVDTYRIETLTHFRGELRGKASVVMWVDPATRAVVRTNGALNLTASYGSYNTTFETNLKSAPGY